MSELTKQETREQIMERKIKNSECRTFTDFSLFLNEDTETEGKELVRGIATTYGEPYTLYSDKDIVIMEQVDKNAFKTTDFSDVIMQYDHMGRVFARTKNGTLKLNPNNERGLEITADLDGTDIGRQLKQEIKGGYTDKMSIRFKVDDEERIAYEENGKIVELRTIKSFAKLYDVSAVSIPANDMTAISVRSYVDGVLAEREAERLKKQKEQRQKQRLEIALQLQGVK